MPFSFGIDIPDVELVILWGLPLDTATLWQEIGRCARTLTCGDAIIYPFKSNIFYSKNGTLSINNESCTCKQIICKFHNCIGKVCLFFVMENVHCLVNVVYVCAVHFVRIFESANKYKTILRN